MWRVRESLFGKSILQTSDDGEWYDVRPNDTLQTGFSITEVGTLARLHERIDRAETRLADYAAAVELARHHKKRLPTLTEVLE